MPAAPASRAPSPLPRPPAAGSSSVPPPAASEEITIGWIHPLTGSLAGFGAPDNWVIQQVMATPQYKSGFKIGGKTYTVNIKSYDSQSSVTQAGNLAKQAIQHDNVDLLLASSTPETVNAVASQANTLGTPLICANVPWESYYVNLHGNPAPGKSTLKPKYSVMYFLGAEHLVEVASSRCGTRSAPTHGNNHKVAAAFPNDADGHAFRAVFPKVLPRARATPRPVAPPTPTACTNYTSMISQFKATATTSSPTCRCPPTSPPCGRSRCSRASSRSWRRWPRCCCSRATPTRWAPRSTTSPPTPGGCRQLPWTSSLTRQTCTDLANAYTAAGLGQPNANISNYTLFEIAYAALTSVNNPHDKQEALRTRCSR